MQKHWKHSISWKKNGGENFSSKRRIENIWPKNFENKFHEIWEKFEKYGSFSRELKAPICLGIFRPNFFGSMFWSIICFYKSFEFIEHAIFVHLSLPGSILLLYLFLSVSQSLRWSGGISEWYFNPLYCFSLCTLASSTTLPKIHA